MFVYFINYSRLNPVNKLDEIWYGNSKDHGENKKYFYSEKLHCRYGQDQIIIINNHFREMGEVGNLLIHYSVGMF